MQKLQADIERSQQEYKAEKLKLENKIRELAVKLQQKTEECDLLKNEKCVSDDKVQKLEQTVVNLHE